MHGQDEEEQVFLVRYEGEPESKKHLRSVKSFVFDSSGHIALDDATKNAKDAPLGAQVMISVVGINYDLSDSKMNELKESFSRILQYVPFTLQYDHIESNSEKEPASPPVESETGEGDAAKAEAKSLEFTDEPEIVEYAAHEEVEPLSTPARLRAQTTCEDIIGELQEASADAVKLLNPFGEALTEADIKYAFDKCDENGDQRIQFKEFKKCVAGLGLHIKDVELKDYFKELDTDHNKVLDYDEFKQALENIQPDHVNIWTKWLSMSTLDMKPGPADPSVEEIAKVLSSKRANWNDRIDHMHAFAKRAVQKMSKKKFDALMRPVREPLIIQLSDRRSAVVRECCIIIAKIAIVQQDKMTRWAPRILESLFSTIRINVDIMSQSANSAAKAVIQCVPDSAKMEILQVLKKASLENYIIVRRKAFEYLQMIVRSIRLAGEKRKGKFWTQVLSITEHGMQDASNEVRKSASLVACELYTWNEDQTEKKLISKLRRATQKAFLESLEEFRAQEQSA